MRARMPKTSGAHVETSNALPRKERDYFSFFPFCFCYSPDSLLKGPRIQTCNSNSEDPTIFLLQALSSNQLNLRTK